MADELLTLNEAAEFLGVNRVKFSRMVKRLNIPFLNSPYDQRVKLFKKADLEPVKKAPRILREEDSEGSARAA